MKANHAAASELKRNGKAAAAGFLRLSRKAGYQLFARRPL